MGGNNSAEHRARLQSLLQARRKQEEGSEKRATAGPAANQKDVTERREDTRSLDELLSFLGVTEGQADGLTKKGQAKTQQASVPSKKKQNKMSERGKLQSKVKERPWEKTGTDSDSCSEKEVDIRQQQQGTSAAHQQPSDEGQLIHKEDDFSTGQSCSSEHDTAFSSTEISPTSNEEAWSSASIFKDLIPLFDSKSHLPMNSVLGSNILQPIIPSRPLPFAGTGRHRARLSALPQLEGEDEDEDT